MTEPGKARVGDLAFGLGRILRPFLIGVLILGAIVGLLLYGANRPEDPQIASSDSGLTTARIMVGERCLDVEVADTQAERAQGLRGRDDIGAYDGMLFVFEADSNAAFTMSGVKFPLTIGFYDGNTGAQVDAKDMPVCDEECPPHGSKATFRNALETAQGELPAGSYTGNCPA